MGIRKPWCFLINPSSRVLLDRRRALSKLSLTHCYTERWEQISMKLKSIYNKFHTSKWMWISRLQNGGHFVSASIYQTCDRACVTYMLDYFLYINARIFQIRCKWSFYGNIWFNRYNTPIMSMWRTLPLTISWHMSSILRYSQHETFISAMNLPIAITYTLPENIVK